MVQNIAAATSDWSRVELRSLSDDQANFVVPVGWTITPTISNTSVTPHVCDDGAVPATAKQPSLQVKK